MRQSIKYSTARRISKRWLIPPAWARLKNPPLFSTAKHSPTSPPTAHRPTSLDNLFETASIDISAGPSIHQSTSSPTSSYPAESTTMASGQPFASRSYAGTKLPDRSANPNAMPFSASSFSRHRGLGNTAPADFGGPEGPKQTQQPPSAPAATQSHGPGQDANPLSRLTEEQREEINEAVRNTSRSMPVLRPPLLSTRRACGRSIKPTPPTKRNRTQQKKIANHVCVHIAYSSPSSTSTATATSTTTNSASPSAPSASPSQNKNSSPS